jgi:DNA-3-methyladenine glycosylase II
MKEKGTFRLRPTGPYDFRLSLAFYHRSRFECLDIDDATRFGRPLLLGNIPVVIRVAPDDRSTSDELRIEWFSTNGTIDPKKLRRLVRHMLYFDCGIDDFYRHRHDSVMRGLIRRFRGFRPILTASVFEAAAWAIIGQQVTLHFAFMLKSRIKRLVDRSISVDGETQYLFPTAEDIANLKYQELRSIQLSGRKAEYLLDFSRLVSSGDLDLENMGRLDYETAYEKLISIRGLGPWTANYILLRGTGHADAFPIGDSGINRAVRTLYGLHEKPDTDFLLQLGEKWRPYRSLASFYLWKSL